MSSKYGKYCTELAAKIVTEKEDGSIRELPSNCPYVALNLVFIQRTNESNVIHYETSSTLDLGFSSSEKGVGSLGSTLD